MAFTDWTEEDAVGLRQYLQTASGIKFLSLLSQKSKMANASTLEEEALNSREFKGAQKMIEQIISWSQYTRPQQEASRFKPIS